MKVKSYVQTSFAGQQSVQRNDCATRAAVNATGIDYTQCDSILSKHGKKQNKGTAAGTVLKAYTELGLNLISVHGTTHRAGVYRRVSRSLGLDKQCSDGLERGISFGKLIDSGKLKNGKYVVVVTGHAVAVIDGTPIDTFRTAGGKSVVAIFKING